MVSILFDADMPDRKRLKHLHDGHIFIYAPGLATTALCEHARANIATPGFPLAPRTKASVRAVIAQLGCDPECTYIEPPRASGPPRQHPHRETWYGAPSAQITWLLALDDTTSTDGVTFFPQYWARPIANTSRKFNYYDRASGIDAHAEEPLDLEHPLRPSLKAGSLVLFSAAHLHAHGLAPFAQRSINFRTVHIEDITAHRGAGNPDAQPIGTSLRGFGQARDGRHFAEELVEEYDSGPPPASAQIFRSHPRIAAN
jgi:hypothetical protein